MFLLLLFVVLFLLLAANAFFVLAEFAIVKVRPSRVAELIAEGDPRATALLTIQKKLDEYLSVCQVGITLASVALGMVGNSLGGHLVGDSHGLIHPWLAIGISYVVVSGGHIVLGEQVPKFAAIRVADKMALWCTTGLRLSRAVFYPALWGLNRATNGMLRLLRLPRPTSEETHSEEELRIILDHSQERGLMSFRRLLFMENVFDFGDLAVKDAMRPRSQVRTLDARRPWDENLAIVKATHFTRYPLVVDDPERPAGLLHLKDLVIRGDGPSPDLRALMRPILTIADTAPLENLIAEMQRKRIHAALVSNAEGRWTGFLTLEDVVEELVGTIRDEFEDEESVRLSDAINLERIHLDVAAQTPLGAVRAAMQKLPPASLPLPLDQVMAAIEAREKLVGTYLGQGIGMPHARVPGMTRPFVMLLRSKEGVQCTGTTEKAHLLFVLLTPAGQPRAHQRLQSIIATLLHESEFVRERLLTAETAAEVLEVLKTGEQAVLD